MSETLVSLWTDVRRRLEAVGVETPVIDARLLLEAGAGVTRLEIVTDPRRPVSEAQASAVNALARRREAREPIAQIVGRRAFWTLELAVNSDVLTPRPETELLVEAVLDAIAPDAASRLLDLGVGSGAILAAVLSERPSVTALGVDISATALAVAAENLSVLGLSERAQLREGVWGEGVVERFDVVVSNPPYIPSAEISSLAPEVARYEPRLALDGGEDGLSAYRAIIIDLPRLLRPGGVFAFEVGMGQSEAVCALLLDAGLQVSEVRRDLAGTPRVVWGRAA